jgi:hypothetical protein
MLNPYHARVDERHFLNLPGFHAGAYVQAYVEDTSQRTLQEGYNGRVINPQPRTLLQIADCSQRINLDFELDSPLRRMNSFHKIDTLITALVEFRDGLVDEAATYRRRQAEIDNDPMPEDPPAQPPALRRAHQIRTAHARLAAARAHAG